jgi:hypothetical protein
MSISVKVQFANEIAESMSETLGNKEFSGLFKSAGDPGELPMREHKSISPSSRPDSQVLLQIAQKLGYKGTTQRELDSDVTWKNKALDYYNKTHSQNLEEPDVSLREHKGPSVATRLEDPGLWAMAKKYLGYSKTQREFLSDFAAKKQAREYLAEHPEVAKEYVNVQNNNDAELMRKRLEEENKRKLEDAKKDLEDTIKGIPTPKNPLAPTSPSAEADAVVVSWTIKNLSKVANALDVNGYAGVANIIDGTIKRIAAKNPLLKEAMDTGIESVEPDKRHLVEEAKRLMDEGDFSGAMKALSELADFIGEIPNLDYPADTVVDEE